MEMSSTVEELMETPTFKRFYSAVDAILDAADDMDLAGIRGTAHGSQLSGHLVMLTA